MSPPDQTTKNTFSGTLLRHLFGVLVCFGLPALVTAIAPVSWLKFQRTAEGDVTAQTKTCLLFVVPFRSAEISPVISVGDRTVTGPTKYERRTGKRDREHRADTEGFLSIEGPDRSVEVQVTPVNLKSVQGKVNGFLANPEAGELRLFVVANWKFSVIGGGLVSLLTVAYIAGLIVALVRFCVRGPSKAARPQA